VGCLSVPLSSAESVTHASLFTGLYGHYLPIREVSRDQQWISDTRAIFYRGFMPEWGEKDYYAFDVTQENSMVSFTGWARYQENPTRYEYLQTYYELTHRSDAPGYPWCEIMVYNPLTMTAQTYTLAHDCFGRVMWDGRRYFYASYTSDNSDGLTLYSLDIETGETTAWVTRSDLMALDSLSPDGRYVVMMLNDGQRANIEGPYPPYVELDPFIYEGPFTSYFAIFDTFEGRWVYETDNWQGSIADWIDSNTFLWFGWETPSTAHIFQIDDTGVTEIGQINNVVAQISPLSPDRHFLLIWNENESARNSLNAFDVQNQRELSLVYWPDPEHYYVALNWAGEHNVTLTIYQSIDGRVDNRKSVTYVINYP
jgi:hypothetical protein